MPRLLKHSIHHTGNEAIEGDKDHAVSAGQNEPLWRLQPLTFSSVGPVSASCALSLSSRCRALASSAAPASGVNTGPPRFTSLGRGKSSGEPACALIVGWVGHHHGAPRAGAARLNRSRPLVRQVGS